MDPLDRETYDISEVQGSTSAGWPNTRGQGWHGGHAGSGGVETGQRVLLREDQGFMIKRMISPDLIITNGLYLSLSDQCSIFIRPQAHHNTLRGCDVQQVHTTGFLSLLDFSSRVPSKQRFSYRTSEIND